jgi:PAS domain S-box-containing protein
MSGIEGDAADALYRLAVDEVPDAVIATDLQGSITIWNRAAAELFGYGGDEVLGRSLDIIIPERFQQAHWEGFRQAVASGTTKYRGRAVKTRAQTKSGEKCYVDFAFALLRGSEGKIMGAVATARKSVDDGRQTP